VIKAEPRFDESEACACGSMHAVNSPDSPRRNTYLALELWDKSQVISLKVFSHTLRPKAK
jgi:hypothetical protein